MPNTISHVLAVFLIMTALPAWSITEGDKFPAVRISGPGQATLDQEQMKGRVTIINFWATWCEACKVELVEMQQEFAELIKHDDFRFAFVSLDKDPAKALAWVKGHLKDPDEFVKYLFTDATFAVADALEVDAFPMTLVVDKNATVVKVHRGFKEGDGSTAALAGLARQLLR